MAAIIMQPDIFGQLSPALRRLTPAELPKAQNDWALCIYILLQHKRPIDYFYVAHTYGITKFQTRLAEVLNVYPGLVKITEAIVPKRLGRMVPVNKYQIEDTDKAIDLYLEVLNKKGEFTKLRNPKKHHNVHHSND
jgi:hypothetical protein